MLTRSPRLRADGIRVGPLFNLVPRAPILGLGAGRP